MENFFLSRSVFHVANNKKDTKGGPRNDGTRMKRGEKKTVAQLLVDVVFSHPLFFSSLSRAAFFEAESVPQKWPLVIEVLTSENLLRCHFFDPRSFFFFLFFFSFFRRIFVVEWFTIFAEAEQSRQGLEGNFYFFVHVNSRARVN